MRDRPWKLPEFKSELNKALLQSSRVPHRVPDGPRTHDVTRNFVEKGLERNAEFGDVLVGFESSFAKELDIETEGVVMNGGVVDQEIYGTVPIGIRPSLIVHRCREPVAAGGHYSVHRHQAHAAPDVF